MVAPQLRLPLAELRRPARTQNRFVNSTPHWRGRASQEMPFGLMLSDR